MRLLSLDLELAQPSQKVIQIGACVISVVDGKIIDTFMVYVNPYEKLSEEIISLTGITQAKVDVDGYPVQEAYYLLKKFAMKNKASKNSLVWGSGAYNDSQHLYKEAKVEEKNFLGHRVLDVKTIYQSMRIRQGKTTKGGLLTSMEECGLKFEGRHHDGLADAINTAKFWYYLTNNFKTS